MRINILLLLIFLGSCTISPNIQYDLVITNVSLIDGTGKSLQKNINVYVNEGKIEQISKGSTLTGNNVINGTGKFLIPGLIDCHTHPNPYTENFPRFIHYGVTSILITGCSLCTNEYYTEMRNIGEIDSTSAPRVFHTSQHLTLEGRHPFKTYPSSNWVDGETIHYLKDTLQIEKLIEQLSKQPIVGLKLTIEDGPLPPFVERMSQGFVNKVVTEANKYGLDVFAHVSDNEELFMAHKAGVKNYLHYVMMDLNPETDSAIIKGLSEKEASIVTTLMLKKSWLYPLYPSWMKRLEKEGVFADDEMIYLKDPIRKNKSYGILKARKFMTGDEIPVLKDLVIAQINDLKLLSNNGVNIALGTDTGNDFILPGISLHEEMQIMELGGFDPLEIIKMSTLNAAKMLKQKEHLGSIEVGKIADMVLLDKNPLESITNIEEIDLVFKNGKIQNRIE